MIELRNNQVLLNINGKSVVSLCELILQYLELAKCSLSISFVGDLEMTALNKQYFGKNCTTDVISFPMEEKPCDGMLLGDVVVCVPQASRYAHEKGESVSEEITLYLIHGILHLIGEQDESPAERMEMEKRQTNLLEKARKAGRIIEIQDSLD